MYDEKSRVIDHHMMYEMTMMQGMILHTGAVYSYTPLLNCVFVCCLGMAWQQYIFTLWAMIDDDASNFFCTYCVC